MTSKNWGDKADKDLFFTILSVKNIGVIGGSEWKTIGNHMRSMGYGFTNEGCRQHFQGLRRAQQKAEANGTIGDLPRKFDPTQDPITRRPGPGRGRPRKSAVTDPGTSTPSTPSGADGVGLVEIKQQQEEEQQQPLALPPQQQSLAPQPDMQSDIGPAPTPMMESAHAQLPPAPEQHHVVIQPEDIAFGDASDEPDEPDEHVTKRPKLEEDSDPALNDEAILSALAAHNNPDAVEHYNAAFYGEA
ncbi:hypothetical protein BD289DRAFT_453985 [Coniella lustricola]|uniref:Myb-like domain-containing protein n=1 Tax=Coniella lustricola TaxID=2025994 RepID=A0A2T3A5A7_9PEZI|nr:hypothetical protein BD289DRAFT_453985 [Coniella lustricola]